MKAINAAVALFVYLSLQGLVYAIDIIARHGADKSWPLHARYHVVLSGIHIIALSLVTALMALGGLRGPQESRRTAWLALAVVSTVSWAAWPIARMAEGEPPPGWVHLVTSLSLGVAVAGLALSYGACFRKSAPAVSSPA